MVEGFAVDRYILVEVGKYRAQLQMIYSSTVSWGTTCGMTFWPEVHADKNGDRPGL